MNGLLAIIFLGLVFPHSAHASGKSALTLPEDAAQAEFRYSIERPKTPGPVRIDLRKYLRELLGSVEKRLSASRWSREVCLRLRDHLTTTEGGQIRALARELYETEKTRLLLENKLEGNEAVIGRLRGKLDLSLAEDAKAEITSGIERETASLESTTEKMLAQLSELVEQDVVKRNQLLQLAPAGLGTAKLGPHEPVFDTFSESTFELAASMKHPHTVNVPVLAVGMPVSMKKSGRLPEVPVVFDDNGEDRPAKNLRETELILEPRVVLNLETGNCRVTAGGDISWKDPENIDNGRYLFEAVLDALNADN